MYALKKFMYFQIINKFCIKENAISWKKEKKIFLGLHKNIKLNFLFHGSFI